MRNLGITVFFFWLCLIHRKLHAFSEIEFIAFYFIDNYFWRLAVHDGVPWIQGQGIPEGGRTMHRSNERSNHGIGPPSSEMGLVYGAPSCVSCMWVNKVSIIRSILNGSDRHLRLASLSISVILPYVLTMWASICLGVLSAR